MPDIRVRGLIRGYILAYRCKVILWCCNFCEYTHSSMEFFMSDKLYATLLKILCRWFSVAHPIPIVFVVMVFVSWLAWVLCSGTHAGINWLTLLQHLLFFGLPCSNFDYFGFVYFIVCDPILCISLRRMNQDRHWVYGCR